MVYEDTYQGQKFMQKNDNENMKGTKLNIALIYIITFFSFCHTKKNRNDDLVKLDAHGNRYFTPMGCLLNGAWKLQEYEDGFGYNLKLCTQGKEVLSKKCLFESKQSEIVFKLYDNNKMVYWPIRNDKFTREGNWKVNFIDSSLYLNFENKEISNIVNKISQIGNGFMSLKRTYNYDSLINGEVVRISATETFYYENR